MHSTRIHGVRKAVWIMYMPARLMVNMVTCVSRGEMSCAAWTRAEEMPDSTARVIVDGELTRRMHIQARVDWLWGNV